jgi:hypothetical protein
VSIKLYYTHENGTLSLLHSLKEINRSSELGWKKTEAAPARVGTEVILIQQRLSKT